jgi:hypothetical protein
VRRQRKPPRGSRQATWAKQPAARLPQRRTPKRGGGGTPADQAHPTTTAAAELALQLAHKPPAQEVEAAARQLAQALPGLLETALRRIRRGKPPTLLRTLRGLLRELHAMLPEAAPRPFDLDQVQLRSEVERAVVENILALLRGADSDPDTPEAEAARAAEARAAIAALRSRAADPLDTAAPRGVHNSLDTAAQSR